MSDLPTAEKTDSCNVNEEVLNTVVVLYETDSAGVVLHVLCDKQQATA